METDTRGPGSTAIMADACGELWKLLKKNKAREPRRANEASIANETDRVGEKTGQVC